MNINAWLAVVTVTASIFLVLGVAGAVHIYLELNGEEESPSRPRSNGESSLTLEEQ